MVDVYIDGSGPPQNKFCMYIPDWDETIIKGIPGDNVTNNIAEYSGLLFALKRLYRNEYITIYTDSELMVKHISGEYKVKNIGLKLLYDQCKTYINGFEHLQIIWIPREKNLAGHIIEKSIGKNIDMCCICKGEIVDTGFGIQYINTKVKNRWGKFPICMNCFSVNNPNVKIKQ